MKKLLICLALVASAAWAQPVPHDGLCNITATPAATLLLPYFEVDIDDPNGVDTFFSINNAEPFSILGHVVVWTDMSVEALDFNVYLTGYDVQTIGMGLIIRDGILPVTDYFDSPIGPYSWDYVEAEYAACLSVLPYNEPALDEEFLNHLQSILTGGPSSFYGGRCGGYPYGDNIARGYVTVDNVLDCTVLTPCDPGYFVDTPATEELIGYWLNALWGDWYMIDYANDFAQGDTLVHVQSAVYPEWPLIVAQEEQPPARLTPAQNLANVRAMRAQQAPQATDDWTYGYYGATFWGRCATAFDEDRFSYDFREPLGTTYAARFYQNAAFTGGTDYLVWRDSLFNVYFGDEDGFSCSSGPNWFPLNERQVVFFDEEENPETACTISPCPEEGILFPIEAQRVSIEDLDVAPESGWTYMNLNQIWNISPYGNVPVAAQAWVTAVHSAEGRFSAGLPAVQLDSMCDFSSVVLGPAGPDYPAQNDTYSPFYYGSYTYGAQQGAHAPQGTGVKSPYHP